MKILRLSYKPKSSHYSNDQFFFEELGRQADVYFLNIKNKRPSSIQKKIDKLVLKYDFDLIYKSYMGGTFDSFQLRPLCEYGIPVVVSAGDCHTRLHEDRLNLLSNYHKFDTLIVNNQSTIEHFKGYFDRNISYIWVPWAYNPKVHKDYRLKKKWNVVIPAGNFVIPTRKKVHKYCVQHHGRKYLDVFFRARKGSISPKKYAQYINRSNIAISTCQRDDMQFFNGKFIGMTFNKFYEIPMCNTLHVAQRSADCDVLGFKDGENVVLFDDVSECAEKIDYYLSDVDSMHRIIEASIQHVRDSCTYEKRVENLLSDLRKTLNISR